MEDLVAAIIGIALMLALRRRSRLEDRSAAAPDHQHPWCCVMAVVDVVRTLREQAGNARS